MALKRFAHQIHAATYKASHPRCFDHSDPGTGKTISTLDAFMLTEKQNPNQRMLVLAPLSILQASWGDDIDKATELSYTIAHGTPTKREAALTAGTKLVIANHDAVNWLIKYPKELAKFTHLCIDEYKVFKNRTAKRSKAAAQIAKIIPGLWLLSGTPNSEGATEIWHPALMVDGGIRLGRNFWDFRQSVCTPVQVGPRAEHVVWQDKPGAQQQIADRLRDVSIRYKLDECISMPERIFRTITLPMPKWLREKYDTLQHDSIIETETKQLIAINAAARAKKLLQLLTGAVYTTDGEPVRIHEERYNLIAQLMAERAQTIVGYSWSHELHNLRLAADAQKLSYAFINGSVPARDRTDIVRAYQAGEIHHLFLHPQAAGHGLTCTAGNAVIWSSPCPVGEWYVQLNARVYRNGQTKRTEVINTAYEDSKEVDMFNLLQNKLLNMNSLLHLFQLLREDITDEHAENFNRTILGT